MTAPALTSCYERYTYFVQTPAFYAEYTNPGVEGYVYIYIRDWDDDMVIRYTLDGSTPTEDYGNIFYDSLYLNAATLIKAVCYKEGDSAGPVGEFYFEP